MATERHRSYWPDLFESFPWPEMWGGAEARLRLEQLEDDGDLVIRAEMPGVDPDEDVDISVHDGRLTISAERREETEDKGEGTYRSEFRYGSFSRTVSLPSGVAADDITASYDDGILEVRVPRAAEEPQGARKVPVQKG
jgi:HSP20 family protein